MNDEHFPALNTDGGDLVFVENVQSIFDEGTPFNTKKAYKNDMKYLYAWSDAVGVSILPASLETVMKFVVDHFNGLSPEIEDVLISSGIKRSLGPHNISTISRRIASLSIAHKMAKYPNPMEDSQFKLFFSKVHKASVHRGIVPRRKRAILLNIFEDILSVCEDDLRGIRDKAILFFAFSSGGRRRSEVSSAVLERLDKIGSDYVYRMGVTKTAQLGDAGVVPIAGRAASALSDWLVQSGLNEVQRGALFRAVTNNGRLSEHGLSDKEISRIVKRRLKMAGYDESQFGGHSLRSGFMTETGLQGISLVEAMGLSLHRSVQTASRYHQAGAGLRNKASRLVDMGNSD